VQLGTIDMTPIDPSCVVGKVENDSDDSPIVAPLDLRALALPITQDQRVTGMLDTAYVGQVTPTSDGTICVPVTAGATMSLFGAKACGALNGGGGVSFNVPGTVGAGACGGTTCADVGTIRYVCVQ
jgi:hypothetical protein